VKYSFTYVGEDGFPYPVNRTAYDNPIETLRAALYQARLDRKERFYAVKGLYGYILD